MNLEPGHEVVELQIPANKVGLVIGKQAISHCCTICVVHVHVCTCILNAAFSVISMTL